jgi:lipooligosaccharide transport system ATP-binding protein
LRVLGMDPRTQASAIKSRLGVVPQQDNLDAEITVRDRHPSRRGAHAR